MTFHLVHQPGIGPAQSPFRIVEQEAAREVAWINRFLDRECVRRLAETTLRSYALDLLHFLRWWVGVHYTDAIAEAALTESTLLDYIRFQSSQQPRPAAVVVLSSPNGPCATSSRMPPVSSHPASTKSIGGGLPWGSDDRGWR